MSLTTPEMFRAAALGRLKINPVMTKGNFCWYSKKNGRRQETKSGRNRLRQASPFEREARGGKGKGKREEDFVMVVPTAVCHGSE